MKTILAFFAPVMISIAVLGFLGVRDTQNYIRENIQRLDSSILQQVQDSIDIVIKDLNTISLNFSINNKSQFALRRILQKDLYDFEDIKELDMILNNLSIAHYSRPFIHSIYVYFDNPLNRFITSDMAPVTLDAFSDKTWHESYIMNNAKANHWWEPRVILHDAISGREISVLTFYKLVYNNISREFNGVVVFNVNVNYLKNILNNLVSMEGHAVFILDNTQVLVSNAVDYQPSFDALLRLPPGYSELQHNDQTYTATSVYSDSDQLLKCVSIIPNRMLYRLPNYLFRLNILYIIISLGAGIGLSLYFAYSSNKQIKTIMNIINSAKEGKLNPPGKYGGVFKSNYHLILIDLINTFIEKDFLKIQLSERLYKSKAAELSALQAQINPHFLFNTLQTINMRIAALGEAGKDVTFMLDHLSLILHYSLSNPRGTVFIEEEISYAKSYLAIQSIRYKDKLSVRWEYDDSVLKFRTIKLLFQPFLENSIYHGIKEKEGTGELVIRIHENQENLSISISDTGAGISPEKLKEIRQELNGTIEGAETFEHIGLLNTNRRIQLMYGDTYGIVIDSRLNAGTQVIITIPKDI
jgi:two-component system sensor histidine kinase YesM